MKKIFSIFAASLMLFAASCSTEKLDEPKGDGNVTFTVQLPAGLQSRAIGDGTTATKLYVAAYEANQTTPLAVAPGTTPVDMSNLTTTVTLQLVTGKTYDLVFWAQADGAPYTFTPNGRTVAMNYGTAANAENRDAFFHIENGLNITGPMDKSITLKRPFAQLNFVTADYNAAVASGIEATTTSVKVKNLKPTLSLVDGKATGTAAEVEFTTAARPTETMTINGNTYDYLAMNYLLIDDTRDVVECEMTAYDEADASDTRVLAVSNVPVQRNYRTNIYGNLLTSTTTYNVTIDPVFDGDIPNPYTQVSSASQLAQTIASAPTNGETTNIQLTSSVNISESAIIVPANTNVVIDLNGNSIENGTVQPISSRASGGNPVAIRVDGNLTITGKGTVYGGSGGNNQAVHVLQGGHCVIYDGEFSVGPDASGAGNSCIESSGGTIEIYGGTFSSAAAYNNFYYVLNLNNSCSTDLIKVYGGKFINYDPAKGDDYLKGNFVADGYTSISSTDENNNTVYEVVSTTQSNIYYINKIAGMGGNVTFAKDITTYITYPNGNGKTGINQKGGTIDGNGFTLSVPYAGSTNDSGIQTTGGTIKNITIKKAFRSIYSWGLEEDLYLEDVTMYPGAYTFNINGSGNNHTVTFTRCNLNGWTSYSRGCAEVKFIDCKFAKYNYAYLRPYSKTTLINCTFTEDMELDATSMVDPDNKYPTTAADIVLKNCKVGETLITADNLTTLLGEDAAGVTIQND